MTGRDYRHLVKLHRESNLKNNDDNLKVLSKLADTNLVKYKQVKYDLFKDFIGERKIAAETSLEKVKKLEECSKAKKEQLFIKQHKFTWFKELAKLNSLAKKYQEDLDDYLKIAQTKSKIQYADIFVNDDEDDMIQDTEDIEFINEHSHIDEIEEFKVKLEGNFEKFKKHTIEPVYNLMEDLKYYLSVNSVKKIRSNAEKNEEILETIDKVKIKQSDILKTLQNESLNYINEIEQDSNELETNEVEIEEGIPQEAFMLESPDEELKLSVLNEFIIIDFKYKEKITQLNENHQAILNEKSKYDGWGQYEHEIFQHIYDQYHYHNINLTNCNFTLRDLLFDRMKRSFEIYGLTFTRNELVKHEEWMNMKKYYQQQKKLLYNEWSESRKGLLIKAEAAFNEAFEMMEREKEKQFERAKQLRICNELYAKVKKFREQKFEALEIQQKLDRIMEEERLKKTKIENEKEKRRREEQKRNINQYHEQIDNERQQLEAKEQEHLENLKEQLEQQAAIDNERIEYRRKVMIERKENYEKKKLAEKLESEAKEKKIEKFLETVKPNVENDPARMMSFTLAEKSRRGVNIDNKTEDINKTIEKFSDKKQLYNVYSYTDKQLNNDARLRIEARLRQAGLIDNQYARDIIKHIPPPTIPRKDTISNIQYNFDLNKN